MVRRLLFCLVLILLLVGCTDQTPAAEPSAMDCSSDEDCTLTTYEPGVCCGTCNTYPVTISGLNELILWQEANCNLDECPMLDCYDELQPIPRCREHICAIELVQR